MMNYLVCVAIVTFIGLSIDNLAVAQFSKTNGSLLDPKFEAELKDILEKFKDEDVKDDILPNRVDLPPFNISHDGITTFKGQFEDVVLRGLQTIKINELSTDFVEMKVKVGLSFANLSLTSQYAMEFGAYFWTKSYDGQFSLLANDLEVTGFAYLNTTNSTLVVGDVDIDLEINKTVVNFENLLSDSYLLGGIVNELSVIAINTVKHEMVEKISSIVRKKLNAELKKIPLFPTGSGDKNAPIDYLLNAAAVRMKKDGLDPMVIPFIREKFSKKVLFVTFNGEIRISDGSIKGLSTIRRTGDIELNLEEDKLILKANMGFNTLKGDFIWGVHFKTLRQYGRAEVHIRNLAISVVLSQEMVKGVHPSIDRLRITSLGQIWIDLKGLGFLNSIFSQGANFITNALKSRLTRKIEEVLKKELQQELNKIYLPVI